MRGTSLLVIAPFVLVACCLASASADDWRAHSAMTLKQTLQPPVTGGSQGDRARGGDLCSAVKRFYRHRHYQPAWVGRDGILPEGAIALTALHRADTRGLRRRDYDDPWMRDLLDGVVSRPVILGEAFQGQQHKLDLLVTALVLRYITHRSMGRTAGVPMVPEGLQAQPAHTHLAEALARALDRGQLASFLEGLGPRHRAFRALQASLPRHQRILATGGWPTVDQGPPLQRGDCGPRVAQLRERLSASGDGVPASRRTCFDLRLETAVRHFQHRHGLAVDGVVGSSTLAALNVPVEARIRQIQLNLERWRWMPQDLGPRYVLVNIPAFELQLADTGRVVHTLRTVVGREDRPTPTFASTITYLELNPYWHVPATIARQDLLPKIQADPGFLMRRGFHVFDSWQADAREIDPLSIDWSRLSEDHFPFRLRQKPAAHNALGRVKFMFPNEQSVYIHDTPARSLFRRSSRPFSSGCVRVEKPLVLARYLLHRQDRDQARLSQALASDRRRVVILDEPVPVYLVYRTAWAAGDGAIHFAEDIYDRDRGLLQAMSAAPPPLPSCTPADPRMAYREDASLPATMPRRAGGV